MRNNLEHSFSRIIRNAQRGKLKIYVGYAPGVGKTWSMLEEAHRLISEGLEVAVGFVETHGRADIASLLEKLERIPVHRLNFRGIALEEMDLEAILERKPHVVLVDELAHTNAPGSPNYRRYQDVQKILSTGINVITTLDIAHVESLSERVEGITSIKVRDILPDSIAMSADLIVNVDVPIEELQERFMKGKIFAPESMSPGRDLQFATASLQALRRLSLERFSFQTTQGMSASSSDETSDNRDRFMVYVDLHSSNNEMLLQYAWWLADATQGKWYVVDVQTESDDEQSSNGLRLKIHALARQLGAMVSTYKGEDVASIILNFASEHQIGHILIEKPGKRSWRKRLFNKPNLLERLTNESRGYSLIVYDPPAYLT